MAGSMRPPARSQPHSSQPNKIYLGYRRPQDPVAPTSEERPEFCEGCQLGG